MNNEMIIASKKRKVLAVYIDLLLFLTFWGLFEHFLKPALPFWAWIVAFGIVSFLTNKFLYPPGKYFLSIGKNNTVEPNIHNNENWLTILLGVLLILEGTKKLVRWTQFIVPVPFFGFLTDSTIQIILNVAGGILFILAGYLILKLKQTGLFLGIALTIGTIVSSVLSWSLWDQVIPQMVEARRNLQGIPVRDGEIEFMQNLFPEMILVFGAIFLIAMLLSMKRFKMAAQPAIQADR